MKARRMLAVGAVIGFVIGLIPAAAATAAGAVAVTSSGISTVKTYTYQDSDEGYAVFTVTDPSREGSQVSQCWVDGDGDLYDCDVYPLRESDYRDGDWRIRQTASGWEIRVYVGYYAMSEDECLDQFRGSGEYGIDLAVVGDMDEVLGEARHTYELVCQGYAGMTKGGASITANVGRASTVLTVTTSAIDAGHDAASAKGCIYSASTGRGTNCVTLNMASGQTSRGWSHANRISFPGVTDRQCKSLKRNPARFTYRVVYRDSSGSVLMEVEHDFKLTCR
jgi:hypothetical protein